MYSGIKERMKECEKMDNEQKKELKTLCTMHHKTINEYLSQNEVSCAVRNALEDRLIELSDTILKI